MSDYERIEQVIRYVDAQFREQPSLEVLAEVAGLSVSHFHRMFHRWAGVPPKQFLKCLTAAEARRRLMSSESILASSLELGLSGSSRLHDLVVTLEGLSPGELKRGGEGLCIDWGFGESPFGVCSLAWTQRGICHLAFQEQKASGPLPPELLSQWPLATWRRKDAEAEARLERCFVGRANPGEPLRLWVQGTAFQVKVWRALLHIPEGRLSSYGKLAKAIGHPAAARALGSACGANPIAYLIPCHRVIRETGVVDAYRWGSTRKKALVAREAASELADRPEETRVRND